MLTMLTPVNRVPPIAPSLDGEESGELPTWPEVRAGHRKNLAGVEVVGDAVPLLGMVEDPAERTQDRRGDLQGRGVLAWGEPVAGVVHPGHRRPTVNKTQPRTER